MVKTHLTIIVVLVVWSATFTTALSQTTTAAKFDEFGDILRTDLIARLDNFAIQLMNEPNAKGFIVVYRTRRDLPGLNHALAMRAREYLVRTRGLPSEQIQTVDGGVAEHLAQELWVVPPGSAPVPRSDARIGSLHDPDAAWKFYEAGFLPLDQHKRFGVERDLVAEAEELEAYANEVKKNPNRTAGIIVYAQYNPRRPATDWANTYEPIRERALDPRATARTELNRLKEILMRVYGLPATRIKLINGGYRKYRLIEYWIVPAGEPLPIPTPNAFPFGRKRR